MRTPAPITISRVFQTKQTHDPLGHGTSLPRVWGAETLAGVVIDKQPDGVFS